MEGLTDDHFAKLGKVSMEAKLMLSQLLVVEQDVRINTSDVNKHMWITQIHEMKIQAMPTILTQEMQMMVANMVQVKLKLNHLTPNQILAYVFSAKGSFGKTAGCFSLLARDLDSSPSQSMGMTNVKKQDTVSNPSSKDPPSDKTQDRLSKVILTDFLQIKFIINTSQCHPSGPPHQAGKLSLLSTISSPRMTRTRRMFLMMLLTERRL